GDYYVIRSNQTTLGGGNIVETNARRHRRNNPALLERLAVMEMGTDRDVLVQTIEGSMPSEFRDLVHRANMQPEAAKTELEEMVTEGLVIKMGKGNIGPGMHFSTASGLNGGASKARSELESYYSLFPLRKGAPKEEIRSRLGMTASVFNHALRKLEEDGVIAEDGALLGLPGYEPKMSDEQKRAVAAYLKDLDSSPYSPPTDAPLDADILNLLSDEGKVVRVSENVVFSSAAYKDMVAKISSHIQENGEITVADVRDLFDTSRKYALALMDYLDAQRITRRVGDARVLR
ncbi:MAG: SelB C-terminal domain-containing protein, partial [Chloroflexi bacterium]|nr:SelB C-terminal domain-containing protein [Chloroflexota bacterium]